VSQKQPKDCFDGRPSHRQSNTQLSAVHQVIRFTDLIGESDLETRISTLDICIKKILQQPNEWILVKLDFSTKAAGLKARNFRFH
jgi:hypothetical protein